MLQPLFCHRMVDCRVGVDTVVEQKSLLLLEIKPQSSAQYQVLIFHNYTGSPFVLTLQLRSLSPATTVAELPSSFFANELQLSSPQSLYWLSHHGSPLAIKPQSSSLQPDTHSLRYPCSSHIFGSQSSSLQPDTSLTELFWVTFYKVNQTAQSLAFLYTDSALLCLLCGYMIFTLRDLECRLRISPDVY